MNDAIARHEERVRLFPDNELAQFSLGKALFDDGQHQRARPHLAAALAVKPDWMALHILLARCDMALGNKEGARAGLLVARDLARAQKHEGPLRETELLLQQLG